MTERIRQLLRGRRKIAVAWLVVLAITAVQAARMIRVVEIHQDGRVQVCHTLEDDPREILRQCGYETSPHDDVEFTGFYGKYGEIEINRAFPVTLDCDGDTLDFMVTDGTVAHILELADVVLDADDAVHPQLDTPLEENLRIVVTRTETRYREERISLPYDSMQIPSVDLDPGEVEVVVEGEEGLQIDYYRQTVVGGVLEAESFYGSELVTPPVCEQVRVGFPVRPVSAMDFGCEFDENGEPVTYSRVVRGQRAAGYSAPPGSKTASGLPAMVGHVAIQPGVIPYGSKLFIRSADGSFIYGYAVAADTGTALAQGIIGVDLFYDSYAASARNGIKYVDIFVLEE